MIVHLQGLESEQRTSILFQRQGRAYCNSLQASWRQAVEPVLIPAVPQQTKQRWLHWPHETFCMSENASWRV